MTRVGYVPWLLMLVCQIGAVMPAWAVEPLPVGFERREFVDEARSNWQNTGHRPLSTVIWYPASAGAPLTVPQVGDPAWRPYFCLLYTSDAADERSSVDLGGRRIIKK